MSYANGTAHFNLPQTVGTDKRDWSDTNEAFAKLDAAVQANTDANTASAEDITVLQDEVKTNTADIETNKTDIASLENNMTKAQSDIANNATNIASNTASITDVRQDNEDMICAYNEPTATSKHVYNIGDYFIYNNILYKATAFINVDSTIIPNTNCSATNVSTELLNVQGTGNVRTALEDMITFYNEGNDEISDHDYAVGDYFIYQDKLYKCTVAIPTGMTITPNTNCTNTSITAQMIAKPDYILPIIAMGGPYDPGSDGTFCVFSIDNTTGKYSHITLSLNSTTLGYIIYNATMPKDIADDGTVPTKFGTVLETITTGSTFVTYDITATKGNIILLACHQASGARAAGFVITELY